MMESRSEALFERYAKLVPKNPVEAELAMSKVHISKNWKVLPRLKAGGRREMNDNRSKVSDKKQDRHFKVHNTNENEDSQAKKKKQNRDAQRAYRERRANRIHELEGTVETLQNMVTVWQKKYKAIQEELVQSKKTICRLKEDNVELENNFHELELKSAAKRKTTTNNTVKQNKTSNLPLERSADDMNFLDPMLQSVISNFKPMQAVTLKKHKSSDISHPSLVDVSSVTSRSPEDASSLSGTSETSATSANKCGFCSDSTTCVCKELERETAQAKSRGSCNGNSITCMKCTSKAEKSKTLRENRKRPRKHYVKDLLDPSFTNLKGKRVKPIPCVAETSSNISYEELSGLNKDNSRIAIMMPNDNSSDVFEVFCPLQTNRIDSSFKPGSCENCEKSVTDKAFCEAMHAPRLTITEITKTETNERCGGMEPGSCVQCQKDPQSAAFCKEIYKTSINERSATIENDMSQTSSDLIPVGDAYQRVRKYMQLKTKDGIDIFKTSTLPMTLRKVASGLRVNGREVESRSVDDAIRELDKNAMS